ncbi:methyltransferase domain-containing protein [Photorhabdus hainanensis]|uniref:methyltransferase domain-containing protein n=1 Tax=Photorhabdus hainanensis TaxID=1004166 RepID=UPI001BD2AE67|nr:methyltransferase domain-containing protein [Photorhabdus hainanensis]MBS9431880.1 methyltransferase domain-containing protein [Photorhabdus hainanensis]
MYQENLYKTNNKFLRVLCKTQTSQVSRTELIKIAAKEFNLDETQITDRLLTESGIRTGMQILEIGCGTGDLTRLIANRVGPSGHVMALDMSSEAINSAHGQRCLRSIPLDRLLIINSR